MSDWVQTRVPELETMLGHEVVSMSWTASDIAAVGHLAEGALRLVAVEAPVWVLATVRARFEHNVVTSPTTSPLSSPWARCPHEAPVRRAVGNGQLRAPARDDERRVLQNSRHLG